MAIAKKTAQKGAISKEKAITADYQEVFGSDAGIRVLKHIALTGGILFEEDSPCPHRALISKGERRIARRILERVLPDRQRQLEKLQEIANDRLKHE